MNDGHSQVETRQFCCYPNFDGSPAAKQAEKRARWYFNAFKQEGWAFQESGLPAEPAHEMRHRARTSNLILAWSKPALFDAPLWLQRRAVLDDPHCDTGNPTSVIAQLSKSISDEEVNDHARLQAYLLEMREAKTGSVVFGSGPLSGEAPSSRENAISIAIGARGLATALQDGTVDVYVAWDIAAHFGPSRTAENHRKLLVAQQRQSQMRVVYPAEMSAFFRRIWPEELLELTIGLDVDAPGFTASRDQVLAFSPSRNVLTAVALPLASAMPGPIELVGISTTRDQLSNGTHWQHEAESAYQRDIAPMLVEHPLFATRNAESYLSEHFDALHRQLGALRKSGRDILGIAPEAGNDLEIEHIGRRSLATRLVASTVKLMDHATLRPAWTLISAFLLSGAVGLKAVELMSSDILIAALIGINIAGFLALALYLRLRIDRAIARIQSEAIIQSTRAFSNLSTRLEDLEQSDQSNTSG